MNGDMPMETCKDALQPQPSTSMFGTLYMFAWIFWRKPPICYLNNLIWYHQNLQNLSLIAPLIFAQQSKNS
jgi:hypothetical protein